MLAFHLRALPASSLGFSIVWCCISAENQSAKDVCPYRYNHSAGESNVLVQKSECCCTF